MNKKKAKEFTQNVAQLKKQYSWEVFTDGIMNLYDRLR